MSELPDFIIVGAMRSGTSSLARWLRDHPGVFMPERKELHFFDTLTESPGGEGVDLAPYRSYFQPAEPGQVCGEATPSYMFLDVARQHMAAAVPGATLIALLRDPMQRAYSHYWRERERGEEDQSFVAALQMEEERLARGDAELVAFSYQARGRYVEQLEALASLVGRERIHVEFFEDLQSRPQDVFSRVCGAIGVEVVDVERVGTQVNAFTTLRSKRLHTWAGERSPLVQKVVGRLNGRPAGYPPMTEEARTILDAHFAPHDDALADWLGRDVPWRSAKSHRK